MKKFIVFLLVVVMCFSLAACGGNAETSISNEPQTNNSGSQQEIEHNDIETEKFDLYQEWRNIDTGEWLTFGKDGLVASNKGAVHFEYDKENKTVSFEINDTTINLNIIAEDGTYKLSNESVCFVTADNYSSNAVVVGNWEYSEENSVLVLNEDGTGELTGIGAFSWMYDDASCALLIKNTDGAVSEYTYMENDDTIELEIGGRDFSVWVYSRVTE